MKLWAWSDLHLEVQEVELPYAAPADADVIVCAGDLCRAEDLADIAHWITDRYRMPMVFVPGNHEYYGGRSSLGIGSILTKRVLMAEAAESSKDWKHRLYVLDDDTAEIGGVRFVGGTLWTDFLMDLPDRRDLVWRMNESVMMMPDFSRIRMRGNDMLAPQDMLDMNRATRAFILDEVAEPFEGRTVVVTHHLPHPACTPEIYRGGKSNYLFASGEAAFGDLFAGPDAPVSWFCGHTHHPVDVRIGGTRVICNPRGYQAARDERDNAFRWDLVVDTEDCAAA